MANNWECEIYRPACVQRTGYCVGRGRFWSRGSSVSMSASSDECEGQATCGERKQRVQQKHSQSVQASHMSESIAAYAFRTPITECPLLQRFLTSCWRCGRTRCRRC
eukprot:6202482-Pleurochrysis_carterae.AAC.1